MFGEKVNRITLTAASETFPTFFAIVARLLSAAMSVGTIAWVGMIGEELGGKRVGACAAAACALNATLVYYGNVTNLDGPGMFWSTTAMSRASTKSGFVASPCSP